MQSKVSLLLNEVWPFLKQHTSLYLEATYLILPKYLVLYHVIETQHGKVWLRLSIWIICGFQSNSVEAYVTNVCTPAAWERNAEFCGLGVKASLVNEPKQHRISWVNKEQWARVGVGAGALHDPLRSCASLGTILPGDISYLVRPNKN